MQASRGQKQVFAIYYPSKYRYIIAHYCLRTDKEYLQPIFEFYYIPRGWLMGNNQKR
jgi:hypothetical protein